MFYGVAQNCFRLLLLIVATATGVWAQIPTTSGAPQNDAAPVKYRLRAGDKLSVKFLYHAELNAETLTVRPDGFINLQLIDDVAAEGLTVAELKSQLEKRYDEILIKPVISIALLEFVAPRVYIGGQIAKPGRYELRDGKTLIEVLFLAGGFTPDADRKGVLHARPDGKGEWIISHANVPDILKQKNDREDVLLQDGDYIFVPDSKISKLNKAVETFRGLLPRFF